MVKTYDSKSYELAEHFLAEYKDKPEYHALCHQLALEIQQAVEDYCEELASA